MPRPKRSNPLALAVLSCLSEAPAHPYELATTLRERGKQESIRLNYGSLYSVVEQLEKAGLIRPLETIRDGRRPERTVYELTDSGRNEHDEWLAELLSTPIKEFPAFEAALSLMPGLPPEEVVRLLRSRRTALEMALAGSRSALELARQQQLPRLFLIEEEYRLSLIATESGFVSQLIGDIESDRLEGLSHWREFIRLSRSRGDAPGKPPD
ncbi:MAG: PadR family transcriptional regulator [Candidatus Dormibacteria bacterium]